MAQTGPARTSVRAHVLRIGVIRDARLVLERTLPLDTPIDLGGAHTDLPLDGVPTHRLFTPLADGLVVDSAVRPRTKARIGELDATLAPGDRGRIDLPGGAGVVVLYQVVPAPPIARAQVVSVPEQVDLRAPWFDENEIPFVQSLALWSALGVLLGVFVATSPAPRTVSVDELPAYLATAPGPVYIDDTTDAPDPEPVVEDDAVAQVTKERAQPEPRPDTPPEPIDIDDAVADAGPPEDRVPTAGERALAEQNRRDALVNRFKKAGIIGTAGDSTWAVGVDDAIAMDHLEAHGEADLDDLQGLRGPDGTGGGPLGLDIDPDNLPDLPVGPRGGSAIATDLPDIPVGLPQVLEEEEAGTGDGAWIAPVVRRYRGQIQYCYEKALKRDPTLGGRVELAVEVDGGRVVDVYLMSDTMRDSQVTHCMMDKMERWGFPADRTGSFTWPYIFRPAGE